MNFAVLTIRSLLLPSGENSGSTRGHYRSSGKARRNADDGGGRELATKNGKIS
jgi:hypothetical protein